MRVFHGGRYVLGRAEKHAAVLPGTWPAWPPWTCVTGFGFADLARSVRPPIKDEFERLPVSKQRKYQLRMRRDHRCEKCGAPAFGKSVKCLNHLVEARERN